LRGVRARGAPQLLLEPPLLPGFGGDARCVRVRVFQSVSRDETIYDIDGFWDRTVSLKDVTMSVPTRSPCCTTPGVLLENSPRRWSKTTRYLKNNAALIELLHAELNIGRNRRRKKMIFFMFC
jgi:hypothetical protein